MKDINWWMKEKLNITRMVPDYQWDFSRFLREEAKLLAGQPEKCCSVSGWRQPLEINSIRTYDGFISEVITRALNVNIGLEVCSKTGCIYWQVKLNTKRRLG